MDEAGRDAAPLDLETAAACLAPVLSRRPSGLLLAVSGGPDSICLMRLVADLARRTLLPPLAVATVDHGLRPASRDDAEFVLREAAAAGLPAHLLTWTGPKPATARQERARAARYGLLADLCRHLGADHLLTAHTRDDQAETVLFRLARGSGPAGLAGMRPFTPIAPGVTLARPLLAVPKARLGATCAARQWPSMHDPSNDDPRYARTRLRALLPCLAREGLAGDGFARVADRMQRVEEALLLATDRIAETAVLAAGPEIWRLDLKPLASLPREFTLRLTGRALRDLGNPGRVRLDRLETAAEACRQAAGLGVTLRRTLHGCRLVLSADGVLVISREDPRRRGIGSGERRPAGPAPDDLPPVKREHGPSLGNAAGDPYIGR